MATPCMGHVAVGQTSPTVVKGMDSLSQYRKPNSRRYASYLIVPFRVLCSLKLLETSNVAHDKAVSMTGFEAS